MTQSVSAVAARPVETPPFEASEIQRHRFTADQFLRMAETGVLTGDDRVELWDGEILEMSPIGLVRGTLLDRLGRFFVTRLATRAIVRVQGALRLDPFSNPQPDILLLNPREDEYSRAQARPIDVLLLIEVSDSTRKGDEAFKIPRYARAGVRECWIVGASDRVINTYREPGAQGYSRVQRIAEGAVSPLAFPAEALSVRDLFAGLLDVPA